MTLFYRWFRLVMSTVIRLFFKVEPAVDPTNALSLTGPVMFVGNHPNGLVDPGLIFMLANRHVTFLSKQPLFKIPLLGMILRGLDALPVYRKQDSADTAKNEGTLTAAAQALIDGRAITIFPEGKSHSEPQLAELKTGCARIALDAFSKGAAVNIVPVGLTYEAKDLFRSAVNIEVGAPIPVARFGTAAGADDAEAVRKLTDAVADALRAVTLNLEKWDDLPILETAESLYALHSGSTSEKDLERSRAFAKGVSMLRQEQPERFDALKQKLSSFRERLDLLKLTPQNLKVEYAPATVAWFVVRNVLWLLTFPLFLVGMAVFFIPFWIPLGFAIASKADHDTQSTIKLLTAMVLGPFYWALLTILAAVFSGPLLAGITFLVVPPLALFTREFYERRTAALVNARTFLVLLSRQKLKARLVAEGDQLASEIVSVAEELRPRISAPAA